MTKPQSNPLAQNNVFAQNNVSITILPSGDVAKEYMYYRQVTRVTGARVTSVNTPNVLKTPTPTQHNRYTYTCKLCEVTPTEFNTWKWVLMECHLVNKHHIPQHMLRCTCVDVSTALTLLQKQIKVQNAIILAQQGLMSPDNARTLVNNKIVNANAQNASVNTPSALAFAQRSAQRIADKLVGQNLTMAPHPQPVYATHSHVTTPTIVEPTGVPIVAPHVTTHSHVNTPNGEQNRFCREAVLQEINTLQVMCKQRLLALQGLTPAPQNNPVALRHPVALRQSSTRVFEHNGVSITFGNSNVLPEDKDIPLW